MEIEKLKQIFDEIEMRERRWEDDNAFQGLQILAKYAKIVIQAAEHDIIYSCNVDDILDKLSEEDAISLAKLNWIIDSESDSFACYV